MVTVSVRPEGCICEPCSDISPNWRYMRNEFGYTTLGEMEVLRAGKKFISR